MLALLELLDEREYELLHRRDEPRAAGGGGDADDADAFGDAGDDVYAALDEGKKGGDGEAAAAARRRGGAPLAARDRWMPVQVCVGRAALLLSPRLVSSFPRALCPAGDVTISAGRRRQNKNPVRALPPRRS